MIIIEEYSLKVNAAGRKYVEYHAVLCCPICGGALRVKDRRLRKYIGADGADHAEFILITRGQCRDCGRLHTLLPDCLQPFKHYAVDVIEPVLDGNIVGCPAEECTIRRWRSWFARVAAYINAALVAIESEFERMNLNWLNPLQRLRESGGRWLSRAMGRYVNSGNPLSRIT